MSTIHSQQELAVRLSNLRRFDAPKRELEQYATPGSDAAAMLWCACMRGDIIHKRVADLGCGTGILGIGALLLGATKVTFVEIDSAVLPALEENLSTAGVRGQSVIIADVNDYAGQVDVVVQNPPFGAQHRHADTLFLSRALTVAPVVYSLHNSQTIPFLRSWVQAQGGTVTEELKLRLRLPYAMEHHRKPHSLVEAALLRIVVFRE